MNKREFLINVAVDGATTRIRCMPLKALGYEQMFDYETVYRSFRLEIPERGNLAEEILDQL